MSRLSELITGQLSRDKILFTGTRRRMTSVAVRGDQMAEELDGACLRCRYLSDRAVSSSKALFWIVESDTGLVDRFSKLTPQFFDVINPTYRAEQRFFEQSRRFRYLVLNTNGTKEFLGPEPPDGWRTWVIPHHHCNLTGYRLSEERIEHPKTIGYLGEPDVLHEAERIRAAVEKMGMRFVFAKSRELHRYQEIDIGIAWSPLEEVRRKTRSNIKATNFAAHGIPSVLPDFESYRDADDALGGGAFLIRNTLDGFLEALSELVGNVQLRQKMSEKGFLAHELYSRRAIASQYLSAIAEARNEWR